MAVAQTHHCHARDCRATVHHTQPWDMTWLHEQGWSVVTLAYTDTDVHLCPVHAAQVKDLAWGIARLFPKWYLIHVSSLLGSNVQEYLQLRELEECPLIHGEEVSA